jgi:DinB superfamily
MTMNTERFIAELGENATRIAGMVDGVSNEEARWKPARDKWSVLEVINHLYDEEREDFRLRLDIMLHRFDEPLSPWDPERLVIERRYNERDIAESLDRFAAERRRSVEWLRGLVAPDWDRTYESPRITMTAGDMFASWIVHDWLHLRQLAGLRAANATRMLAPYDTAYASPR